MDSNEQVKPKVKVKKILLYIVVALAIAAISASISIAIYSALNQKDDTTDEIAKAEKEEEQKDDGFNLRLIQPNEKASASIFFTPYREHNLPESFYYSEQEFDRHIPKTLDANRIRFTGSPVGVISYPLTEEEVSTLRSYLSTDIKAETMLCSGLKQPPILYIKNETNKRWWTIDIFYCQGNLRALDSDEGRIPIVWSERMQNFLMSIINREREKYYETVPSEPTKITLNNKTKTIKTDKLRKEILQKYRFTDAPAIKDFKKEVKKLAVISFSDGSYINVYRYHFTDEHGKEGYHDCDFGQYIDKNGKSRYVVFYTTTDYEDENPDNYVETEGREAFLERIFKTM